MKSRISPFLPIIMLIIANGCSPAGNIANMVPKISEAYPQSTKSLKLGAVSGGAEPSIWDGPRIYRNSFEKALALALEEAKLFRQADSAGNSDYVLNALIRGQDQPSMGLSMTSTLAVIYTLVDSGTGDEVWKKEIYSDCTASFTSSCIGSARLAKANDGAARENIRQLLDELSKLGL